MDMKKVKTKSVNKIGMTEEKVEVVEVEAEEVSQATQELSASNVGSTNISQRTVDLRARRKQNSFLRMLRKREY